jgi:hypothetical protein
MGQLLTLLGIDDEKQSKLPNDIFQAEKLIIGMQKIYEEVDNESKKDKLATAISEMVRITLLQIKSLDLSRIDEIEDDEEQEETSQDDEQGEEEQEEEPTPMPMPTPMPPLPKKTRKQRTPKPKKAKQEEPKQDIDDSDYNSMSLEELDDIAEEIKATLFFFEKTDEEYIELNSELQKIKQIIENKN